MLIMLACTSGKLARMPCVCQSAEVSSKGCGGTLSEVNLASS